MEASASLTCVTCRERWIRTHDPLTGRYIEHTPIGYVKVFTDDATQPTLARSYADLRAIVLPLAEGARVRVQLVAYMLTVGEGYYTRVTQGFAVLHEAGACEGLHLAMREAI